MEEFNPFKVNSYTLEELKAFLSKGITFQDLQQSGLNYKMQQELKSFIEEADAKKQKEARQWQMAHQHHTIEDYKFYLSSWRGDPLGIHVDEAEYELEKLEGEIVGKKVSLLADMKENPWRYRQDEMRNLFKGVDLADEAIRSFLEEQGDAMSEFLLTGGKLTMKDLIDAEVIPADLKQTDLMAVDYQMPATQIRDMGDFPTDRTDVYFLGVPRSGKSSVLAGIIYKLWKDGRAGYESQLVGGKDPCQPYYNGLIRSISTMKPPQGTALDTVSFMKLNIRNKAEQRKNPITIVEISGESFRQLADKHMMGADMWAQLGATKCITNNNRKLLFFVLDYSVISEKNLNGDVKAIDQLMALQQSLNVFTTDGPDPKRPDKNCTMSKVDTVAVIMTKCDLMNANSQEERLDIAEQYIKDNFKSFMNDLREACEKYGINRQNSFNPYVLAFSLGKFTVGNTVIYDGEDSEQIIEFISTVTRGESKSFFGNLSEWFR